MSLLSMFDEKKDAFAPPEGYATRTYTSKVAKMNTKGTAGNDLVQRDKVDPTFRPPLASNSYLETVFQKGLNKNA